MVHPANDRNVPADDPGDEPAPGPADEEGLSLDQLNAAFAQMLSAGRDPYEKTADSTDEFQRGGDAAPRARRLLGADETRSADDDHCDVTPRSILEALLFVGTPEDEALSAERVAGLMRGVRPAEIEELVRDLNSQYDSDRCPYRIVSEGSSYRLALREEYTRVRDKLRHRDRQARLSAAAIEVLAIVAYNQPVTGDDVARLRGRPSGSILAQLVRRRLVRIDSAPDKPRPWRYATTDRFLSVFGLKGLEELPDAQELDPR